MKTILRGGLRAPQAYWDMSPCLRRLTFNGCGPAGSGVLKWISKAVPDNLLGVDITEACFIHDFCYLNKLGKAEADNLFWENMDALIDQRGGWLSGLRHVMSFHYYLAVKNLGQRAYD